MQREDQKVLPQEDIDLALAKAASLGTGASHATAAGSTVLPTEAKSSSETAVAPGGAKSLDQALRGVDFCWVDSHWLRQWVVGEHLPPPGEPAPASASTKRASVGSGSSSGDPVVLDSRNASASTVKAWDGGAAESDGGGKERKGEDKQCSQKFRCVEADDPAEATAGQAGGKGEGAEEGGVCGEGGGDEERNGATVGQANAAAGGGKAEGSTVAALAESGVGATAAKPVPPQGEGGGGGVEAPSVGRREGCAGVNGVVNGFLGRESAQPDRGEGKGQDSTEASIGAKPETGRAEDAVGALAGGSPGGIFSEPMRNRPIVCDHGRLHPASVSRLKLVTRDVYEGIVSEEGMSPPDRHITSSNFRCEHCVRDHIGQK